MFLFEKPIGMAFGTLYLRHPCIGFGSRKATGSFHIPVGVVRFVFFLFFMESHQGRVSAS